MNSETESNSPSPEQRRTIRSFVLREGRLTPAQERAFRELWPRFGLDWIPETPINLHRLFGNDRPVVLEIGFGNGESLATMAEHDPERNWLGIEVHRPGVGHLLLEIERRGIENLRLMRHDALEVLEQGFAPASLERVQLFFPDPWPKRRHHKRRILNARLIAQLTRCLRPGGIFHAATDWEPYAEQMLDTLDAVETLENTAGRGHYAPRPAYRPLTKFEQRGERLGHRVHDLLYRRR